jgi:hypothetical protein
MRLLSPARSRQESSHIFSIGWHERITPDSYATFNGSNRTRGPPLHASQVSSRAQITGTGTVKSYRTPDILLYALCLTWERFVPKSQESDHELEDQSHQPLDFSESRARVSTSCFRACNRASHEPTPCRTPCYRFSPELLCPL